MRSEFGTRVRVEIAGESHGDRVSGRVTGLPAGLSLSGLDAFLARRRGGGALTTPRGEADVPEFLSGVRDGKTDGAPISFTIPNGNVRDDPFDYRRYPRPSHADYPAGVKDAGADLRGGGHFSGRLTAPLCVAGYFALEALALRGVSVGTRLLRVGPVTAPGFDPLRVTAAELAPVPLSPAMAEEILRAKAEGDSVGGVIECAAVGLPVGLGSPIFDGLENRLSAALFGLGGVRGVEFGDGFAAASMRGSEHNDPYTVKDGHVATASNHAGGVLGGMATGMPLLFRAAFKPTPSIGKAQTTVDLQTMTEVTLENRGRHDPCIALRALPCVEAVTALVLCDFLAEESDGSLASLRGGIDAINREMRELLLRRLELCREISACKRENGLPVRDEAREAAILAAMLDGVPEETRPHVKRFFEALMADAREYEEERK